MSDERINQALADVPRDDLLGFIKTAADRQSEAPKLYDWLLSAAFDTVGGDEPGRLAPATWTFDELESGLRRCGVWCKVCRKPGRRLLLPVFQAVADALLDELTERRGLSNA